MNYLLADSSQKKSNLIFSSRAKHFESVIFCKIFVVFYKFINEERGRSMVECLTLNRGVAGKSLSGGTGLCP